MKLHNAIKTWLELPLGLCTLGLYSRSFMLNCSIISLVEEYKVVKCQQVMTLSLSSDKEHPQTRDQNKHRQKVESRGSDRQSNCGRKKQGANQYNTKPQTWHWIPAHGETMVVKGQKPPKKAAGNRRYKALRKKNR